MNEMHTEPLKARVVNGRLVLDEPTDLPEGTEVSLVIVDEGDDLDDEERAALLVELRASIEDKRAGRLIDAEEVKAEIRARRT